MARVLLCTRGGAIEAAAIADALRARAVESIVFDSAGFPNRLPVSLGYEDTGFQVAWPSSERAESRDVGEISAVWQSLVVGSELPEMAPGMRETCVAASELALIGWLESLQVFQLDPYAVKARADNKPSQLRLAQRVGLEIPATIISNDPEAVRAFARRVGPVIMKMLVQPSSTGPATDETEVVFTTAMTPEALEASDGLAGLDLCPMIFQAQVENQRDVRATVVGRRVFGAALDPMRDGSDLDWRRQSYALDRAPPWVAHELPAEISDRLLQLMDLVGLNYGAADFIVRPDGRHVFLELNASGSFGFLGDALARPIAAAIAEILVEPGARRIP